MKNICNNLKECMAYTDKKDGTVKYSKRIKSGENLILCLEHTQMACNQKN